jgi:FAD/FMN-containing dehydrogenase
MSAIAGQKTIEVQLAAIVGASGLIRDAKGMRPYLRDWRGNYVGNALAVVRPANTAEVAAVVKLCAETRTPMVPQGGNTGLVGGGIPDAQGNAIVLSLTRMNRIRAIDIDNNTITVEAGVVLQALQAAAADAGRLFPLSLAAEGSCTIGGNLSTNAGGTAVLRYGNTRDLTLGLEVVTPAGEIWDGLKGLRKDNTGYDLKQCFIGAEGTLGIITAAVLKLFPAPLSSATALVAIASPQAAVELLGLMRNAAGDRLVAFELVSRICLDLVVKHFPGTAEPFPQPHPWQVLVELSDTLADAPLQNTLEAALGSALEQGLVRDAAIAASAAQAKALWKLREDISEAQRLEGKNVKHDISVPISHIAEFIRDCDADLMQAFPHISLVCFGHVGDGNLHYNCGLPGEGLGNADEINRIVYDHVAACGGSISAEHGLGQLKRAEITRHKTRVELDLMRALKRAWDPGGIMNPGKVL